MTPLPTASNSTLWPSPFDNSSHSLDPCYFQPVVDRGAVAALQSAPPLGGEGRPDCCWYISSSQESLFPSLPSPQPFPSHEDMSHEELQSPRTESSSSPYGPVTAPQASSPPSVKTLPRGAFSPPHQVSSCADSRGVGACNRGATRKRPAKDYRVVAPHGHEDESEDASNALNARKSFFQAVADNVGFPVTNP